MDSWSVFGFAQKNVKSVFGFGNPDWDFPKRTHPKCRYFYLSVHVVVELNSNIMRRNWGFRWWPKNALWWQITSNQNLIGMEQAVDTLRNTVSIPEGVSMVQRFKLSTNATVYTVQEYPLTIIHVWKDAIRKLKQKAFFRRRASTGSETIFFNMLWRCQVWNAKGVFSHTDDLSEILSKSTAQECKRCNSGWLASLKSLSTVNPWTDY